MLIVPLLWKNLIAFIRISTRQLIHTGVKGFTAVLTVVFNKLRVLDRQKFPSRNFLSPRLPQKRTEISFISFCFFSSPFSLWAVLITNLYNVAMNWINWLNYMTNVTIHRQPTLLLFHNSIWLSNPNYAKFFTLNTFFFYFHEHWLTFLNRESKTTDLISKAFSFSSFINFSKTKLISAM